METLQKPFSLPKSAALNILFVSTIILLICLVIMALFTKRYADFWFKILVSNKAELVNEILAREEIPQKWRLGLLERVAKKDSLGSLSSSLAGLLKRWYLFRLDRLVGSLGAATYINKDLKAEYLAALKEIKEEWQERQDLF